MYVDECEGSEDGIKVHKFAEEALINYIYYKVINAKRHAPAVEKQWTKKEFFRTKKVAKSRIKSVRLENVMQAAKSDSVWIKGLKQTIIVKPITNEERKENGIYIPIKYEENLYRYEVIRSGVGELPEGLNKGDVIFTRSTNGCNVDLHGETVKVINRNEIIAIDG